MRYIDIYNLIRGGTSIEFNMAMTEERQFDDRVADHLFVLGSMIWGWNFYASTSASYLVLYRDQLKHLQKTHLEEHVNSNHRLFFSFFSVNQIVNLRTCTGFWIPFMHLDSKESRGKMVSLGRVG